MGEEGDGLRIASDREEGVDFLDPDVEQVVGRFPGLRFGIDLLIERDAAIHVG